MEEKEHFHVFGKNVKDEEIVHYDVCIVGGGPAGLSAGIYSSRYGLHTALISKDIGGTASLAHSVENYPGFLGSGAELMKRFYEQAKKFGVEFLKSEVSDITKEKTGFVIELSENKMVHSRTIIIALGTEKRKLGILGEKEFLGKGVSYCASCDANFFRNKVVAVVGGGNSAARTAMLLAEIAKKVYVIYKGEDMRCEYIELKRLREKKNTEIRCNSIAVKIKGKKVVKSLVVEEGKKKSEVKIDGIFIEVGASPSSLVIRQVGVNTDENGYILVNVGMETNIPGIFAAGDMVKSRLKQIITAAAQGAIAAKSSYDFIKK